MLEGLVWSHYRKGHFSHGYLAGGRLGLNAKARGFEPSFELKLNPEESVFDLASLTKALVIVPLFWEEERKQPGFLRQSLASWVGAEARGFPRALRELTIEGLLAHRGGLAPWRSLFLYQNHLSHKLGPQELLQKIFITVTTGKHPTGEPLYTDLGYMLLGLCWQLSMGKTIPESYGEFLRGLGGGLEGELFYPPFSRNPSGVGVGFVPTSYCKLRGRWLQGEVHDENAYVLGGVSGHAGLFGTPKGLVSFLERWLLSEGGGLFLDRCGGLGATLPRTSGFQSAGVFPGWQSLGLEVEGQTHVLVGHLGFTGVGFWIEPKRDCPRLMLLLTNRVRTERLSPWLREFRAQVWGELWSKINP